MRPSATGAAASADDQAATSSRGGSRCREQPGRVMAVQGRMLIGGCSLAPQPTTNRGNTHPCLEGATSTGRHNLHVVWFWSCSLDSARGPAKLLTAQLLQGHHVWEGSAQSSTSPISCKAPPCSAQHAFRDGRPWRASGAPVFALPVPDVAVAPPAPGVGLPLRRGRQAVLRSSRDADHPPALWPHCSRSASGPLCGQPGPPFKGAAWRAPVSRFRGTVSWLGVGVAKQLCATGNCYHAEAKPQEQ